MLLGCLWEHFGAPLGSLGALWEHFGCLWGSIGPLWAHLGNFGHLWEVFGAHFEVFWRYFCKLEPDEVTGTVFE